MSGVYSARVFDIELKYCLPNGRDWIVDRIFHWVFDVRELGREKWKY